MASVSGSILDDRVRNAASHTGGFASIALVLLSADWADNAVSHQSDSWPFRSAATYAHSAYALFSGSVNS
jgi:hypothetical protein